MISKSFLFWFSRCTDYEAPTIRIVFIIFFTRSITQYTYQFFIFHLLSISVHRAYYERMTTEIIILEYSLYYGVSL